MKKKKVRMVQLAGLAVAVSLSCSLNAQTYSRTETITYHDNTSKWVLGQTASVTCTASVPASTACDGDVVSQTTYDATYALPLTQSSFGKLQQTLTYDTTSAITTGQRGTLKTAKDGNNNVTTLSNWKRGIPQSIKYPATPESPSGAVESAFVNDSGWIESVTDENGYKTCYGYDAMGRLGSITYPSEATPGICDASTWAMTTQVFEPVAASEYGIAAGHWRQTITTGNGQKITYFDALWRPLVVREYDAANVAGTQRFQRFAYDHEGRVTFAAYPGTTDALTTGTWTEYDALGRVSSVSQDSEHGLLTTTTAYLTGFQTRVTNPRGYQTLTSYQAFDQPSHDWPVAIWHPEGAITEIGRDVFGKPTSIIRRNGDSSVWARRYFYYDANQQLCKSKETETGISAYGYDGAGNLTWSASGLPWSSDATCEYTATTAAARRVDRTYDARNRLSALTFPDGLGNQAWTYTADGLPDSITTYNAASNGTPVANTYAYNKRRLMTQEAMARNGGTPWYIGYTYNANGHLSGLDYPSALYVDYAPNALGQPTKASTYATGVSYYPNGGIKQFTYGNGIVHTMTQNVRQLPSRSTDVATLDLAYSYDANANVSQITDYVNGRQTRSMTYDGLDRLTQATSTMWGTASYTYDVLDNLTRATVGASATQAARDHFYCYTNNRLTNLKTGSCSGTSVVGLSYDLQGNLANKSGQAYTFDFGNRLRVVTGKESYLYDGHGRRVQATLAAGQSVVSQYSQAGQLLYQQDYRKAQREEYVYLGGSLLANLETPHATGSATVVKYQHTDALGSPIATTGANKAILETTEYEPYGRQSNRAIIDGPGYTGHVQDAATGLTYMQQRYYDPGIGRFLSVDPIGADPKAGTNFNRYKYAANNPYRVIDPDGRADLVLFGANDPLYAAGQAFDIPGMFTLAGHANSQFIQGANREQLTPDQTIALARSAGLKEGHTFFVGACNVGADGGAYAQALANKNNSLVLAATGFAMFPTTKDPDPTDNRGPYKPGNPVTLTVNSQRDGKGTPGSFAVFAPGGNGPMASGIRSATFSPETGKAQLRLAPETGTRIGRTVTVCADKDKCG